MSDPPLVPSPKRPRNEQEEALAQVTTGGDSHVIVPITESHSDTVQNTTCVTVPTYCKVPLQFETSPSELEKTAFKEFLIRNRRLKDSFVVVTPLMVDLFQKLQESTDVESYILMGPKGTGKTTSLYWLYHQLQHISYRPLPILAKQLENTHYFKTIAAACKTAGCLLVELLHIYKSGLPQLTELIVDNPEKKVVFAASSSLQGMEVLGYREQSCIMNSLLMGCIKIYTKPFNDAFARKFMLECYGHMDIVKSGESLSQLIKKSCYIPGIMSMSFQSFEDMEKNVTNFIMDEWETIFEHIANDKLRTEQNMKLWIAVYHQLPISIVKLSRDEAEELLPIKCFLIYINENMVPVFYVQLAQTVLSNMMSNLKFLPGVRSDEPTVLGFCFEGAVSVVLQNIRVNLKIIHRLANVQVPNEEDEFILNHTISPIRYDVQTTRQVSKSLLCRTAKLTSAVDYFSIVDVQNIGLCLLVIQISTRPQG